MNFEIEDEGRGELSGVSPSRGRGTRGPHRQRNTPAPSQSTDVCISRTEILSAFTGTPAPLTVRSTFSLVHRDIDALVREELISPADKTLLPPVPDLLSRISGTGSEKSICPWRNWYLRKWTWATVYPKRSGHHLRGQTLHERGPECLVAPLPVRYRMGLNKVASRMPYVHTVTVTSTLCVDNR